MEFDASTAGTILRGNLGRDFSSLSKRYTKHDLITVEDISKAIERLPPHELARFRAWFEEFDARRFDAAIERDAQAGELDARADEAIVAHRAGRSRAL